MNRCAVARRRIRRGGALVQLWAMSILVLSACTSSGPSVPADAVLPAADSLSMSRLASQEVPSFQTSTTNNAVPRLVDRATGVAAHDFEMKLFGGEMVTMSDYHGKIVVLNFWASWCVPCRWEMPFFQKIWEEYREQDIVFVGVAVSDDPAEAAEFASGIGITYPIGLDATGRITRDYRVTSLPTTFIIDLEGNESRKFGTANETVLRLFLKGQLRKVK